MVKEKQDDLCLEIYRSLFAASRFICFAGNNLEYLFVATAQALRPFAFQPKRLSDAAVILQLYLVGCQAVGTAATDISRLAKQHSLPVLISGGQVFSDGASEALVAKRILLQLGLPQEQIIVETQSRTTKENAAYTAALCCERGYNNVLLLTSALHMPRSMQFFDEYLGEQGVKVAPYPCDYMLNPQGSFNPRWLVPQLQAFDITCMALHEYIGMAGAFLQC